MLSEWLLDDIAGLVAEFAVPQYERIAVKQGGSLCVIVDATTSTIDLVRFLSSPNQESRLCRNRCYFEDSTGVALTSVETVGELNISSVGSRDLIIYRSLNFSKMLCIIRKRWKGDCHGSREDVLADLEALYYDLNRQADLEAQGKYPFPPWIHPSDTARQSADIFRANAQKLERCSCWCMLRDMLKSARARIQLGTVFCLRASKLSAL